MLEMLCNECLKQFMETVMAVAEDPEYLAWAAENRDEHDDLGDSLVMDGWEATVDADIDAEAEEEIASIYVTLPEPSVMDLSAMFHGWSA